MQVTDERNLETIPVGPLGIIPLESCKELGDKVNSYLVAWRNEREHEHKSNIAFKGYQRDSYIIGTATPRFGSGEAKGVIKESVRGDDLYIMVDVCNYNMTYSLYGYTNHMSPDDHFQDLKRIIAAVGGKAKRITVIMPFLYESRQHKRTGRESLDCALALQELVDMGVDNIITFDAHDPRVQNAIPLKGFETVQPVYQFIKGLFKAVPDLHIDKDTMMIISPDEGGMGRAIYMSNVLSVDMGMFYKRRDYARIVNGKNPKKRKAGRIFICATFGLFTDGMDKFDKAYEEGLFDYLLTTNLVYQTPELLQKPYYVNCDMSKYIAYIIDTLNHDTSISSLLSPLNRINKFLKEHNNQ